MFTQKKIHSDIVINVMSDERCTVADIHSAIQEVSLDDLCLINHIMHGKNVQLDAVQSDQYKNLPRALKAILDYKLAK